MAKSSLRGKLSASKGLRQLGVIQRRFESKSGFERLANKWASIYLKFLQNRFRRNSRGGGSWPKITKRAQKTKITAKWGRRAILADTTTLYRALDYRARTVAPGQFRKVTITKRTASLEIGYGGGYKHPRKSNDGSSKTIRQVAEFHQLGKGRNPKREIIVPPDAATINLMSQATKEWIVKQFKV